MSKSTKFPSGLGPSLHNFTVIRLFMCLCRFPTLINNGDPRTLSNLSSFWVPLEDVPLQSKFLTKCYAPPWRQSEKSPLISSVDSMSQVLWICQVINEVFCRALNTVMMNRLVIFMQTCYIITESSRSYRTCCNEWLIWGRMFNYPSKLGNTTARLVNVEIYISLRELNYSWIIRARKNGG